MQPMIFPNLPVRDVAESKEFWTRLGFGFNSEFSSDEAACLVINDSASVMLLAEKFFHGFHDTTPHTGTEILMGLGAIAAPPPVSSLEQFQFHLVFHNHFEFHSQLNLVIHS